MKKQKLSRRKFIRNSSLTVAGTTEPNLINKEGLPASPFNTETDKHFNEMSCHDRQKQPQ